MRIGVYGGSFNPIHAAHMALLETFAKHLRLDRALLVPAGIPPHKAAPDLASGEDRLAMCRAAARDFSVCPMDVTDMELRRAGKSYTADTLSALRAEYPGDELFFLMGEDMFLTVQNWRAPEKILALATVCAVPRTEDGFRRLIRHSESLAARFSPFSSVILNAPFHDISSTEIRERVRAGTDAADLLPPGVYEYIERRGLYR